VIEVLVGEWQAVESARAWQDEPAPVVAAPVVDEVMQQRANAVVASVMG